MDRSLNKSIDKYMNQMTYLYIKKKISLFLLTKTNKKKKICHHPNPYKYLKKIIIIIKDQSEQC